MSGSLFDFIEVGTRTAPNDDWRPEAPPCLDGIDEIYLNFETTGLKWFEDDRPISASLYAGDKSYYLPWGHAGGGNLDETVMKRWAQRELRGKLITNINTRFDIHMARVWGVDLEEQGNRVSDVSHYAALLDDHRFKMNLDSLITDYLHETPMVRLDESRMASYSAGAAAPRSQYNVDAVRRLKQVMWPMLDAQGLQRVRQLEDNVIYVVCEMEKNGTILNQELLEQWIKETRDEFNRCLLELAKTVGFQVNPNSSKDQTRLFKHLNIPFIEFTDSGLPSFTDAVVKSLDHPTIKLLRRAKKMSSLNSKFRKYKRVVDSKGILRYAMHQLRASKDESADSGETGTVVGRFTSTEITEGVGVNIQQVMKPEKQFYTYGDEYFVRNLHIPEFGQWLSVDAAQIQYRIFSHEANNPKVLAAYAADPFMSFHKMMWKALKAHKPDLTYKRTKDVNFAKIFAAGPTKLGWMLEFITKHQYEELKAQKANRHHPLLAQVAEILKIYDKELPEGTKLQKAATAKAETVGYIKDIIGRRMRFINGQRSHKALNGRIIMSEASIVKQKAVELHDARKETGFKLIFQVHDEFDGYIPDEESAKKVSEILNRQSFKDLRVPILWESSMGISWGDCAREELAKFRLEANQ